VLSIFAVSILVGVGGCIFWHGLKCRSFFYCFCSVLNRDMVNFNFVLHIWHWVHCILCRCFLGLMCGLFAVLDC